MIKNSPIINIYKKEETPFLPLQEHAEYKIVWEEFESGTRSASVIIPGVP